MHFDDSMMARDGGAVDFEDVNSRGRVAGDGLIAEDEVFSWKERPCVGRAVFVLDDAVGE